MRLWRAKRRQTANTQITSNTYAGHKRKKHRIANETLATRCFKLISLFYGW
ncbi:hypothetical protein FD14_GL001153 [Secundilactobacillus similis DSM 23365 = JCM 2765]|uniref:Uncharacterized protein n=1 Tax=Secundilactobacillus similis DSM 23365 = JCM 2765 TaxID=1423804 RepID=A0A0R2F082_9LACO|nr:hypothetical protein FD14_GL001153 [Secundilactobacillus similis DSM 23365 = JCM 2765]